MATAEVVTAIGDLTHLKQTIPAGENGEPVLITHERMTVVCRPSMAGSGKIQFSVSPPAVVNAETAIWMDWSRGVVSSAAADIAEGPITAIRGVSVSGVLEVEVLQ